MSISLSKEVVVYEITKGKDCCWCASFGCNCRYDRLCSEASSYVYGVWCCFTSGSILKEQAEDVAKDNDATNAEASEGDVGSADDEEKSDS